MTTKSLEYFFAKRLSPEKFLCFNPHSEAVLTNTQALFWQVVLRLIVLEEANSCWLDWSKIVDAEIDAISEVMK